MTALQHKDIRKGKLIIIKYKLESSASSTIK